jgi:hypothetical protein
MGPGFAKAESCLLSFFAPQDGHFTGLSESVRAKYSKALPQVEQAYSKIGINQIPSSRNVFYSGAGLSGSCDLS